MKLKELQWLSLSHNRLTELPEWIGQLSKLKGLYLSRNQLERLPKSLGNLTQLEKLEIYNNPLNPQLADAYAEGVPSVLKHLQSDGIS